MKRQIVALLVVSVVSSAAIAENWPGWRGAEGQGQCGEKDLPLTWGQKENVRWKVPLPESGNSTPVVWGDRVFVTQASEKTWPPKGSNGGPAAARKRSLLCFARADGKLLWQRDVIYPDIEYTHPTNPYCAASPVTDGERVIVSHGSAGMYCYDFTGKELWKKDLGKLEHVWGNASSPILYKELAILWCGPGERQFLLAVNKKTGDKVWEHTEAGGADGIKDKTWLGSWSTPIIVKVNGRDQLILGVPKMLKGFDPSSGKELWSCAGLGNLVYASSLYADGIAVQMSGFHGPALAVKLGGSGDITKDRLWHHTKGIPQRIGSGVILGEHIYILEADGTPHCFELKTGKEIWKVDKRPGDGAWGSMVHANGRLYVTTRSGATLVFAASPKYELLATNQLGEHVDASIAISDGDIFIRSYKHLWCIGAKAQAQADIDRSGIRQNSEALAGAGGILANPATGAKPSDIEAARQKTVTLKKGDHIIFFGDSLTALAGQEEPKKYVTKGYVRIVRETLQQTHKDKNIEVGWVATGGHTVPDLLKRVDKDVIAKKPTIVVIQIGCNDARRIPRTQFKDGLEELIDRLHKANIQVVQCSLTSVGEKHDGTNKADPQLEDFADIARNVAVAKQVPLNDLRRAFVEHWKKNNPDNKPNGILTYDGNHFNDAGHQFVAEQMLERFK